MASGEFYLLVTGARDWDDYESIHRVISHYKHATEEQGVQLHVVCGAQRKSIEIATSVFEYVGADWLAIEACVELNVPFHGWPADWEGYRERLGGRGVLRAGIDRNQAMLDYFLINEVAAFHENIGDSKGTKDMVKRAVKAGIPHTVYAS